VQELSQQRERTQERTQEPVRLLVVLQRCADDVAVARRLSRQIAGRLAQGFGAPLRLSRSATSGLAAVACARHAVPGVDIERIRPELLDAALRSAALTPEELALDVDAQDFYATWARKEAVLKAMEIGLALPPASFAVGPSGPQWSLARHDGGRTVWVLDIVVPAGCAGALAVAIESGGEHAALEAPPAIDCRILWLQPT
jgi:phosphopantetheinyl transferase